MTNIIDDVAAAIAAIVEALPAVVISTNDARTFHGMNPPPAKIDTAEMPAVYVFTGPATDDLAGGGEDTDRETRVYAVQCAVLPNGQGTARERETRCRPLLVALKDALRARPHLGTNYVERSSVLGDSGIVVLPDYDGANIGFEIRLSVTMRIGRLYADFE